MYIFNGKYYLVHMNFSEYHNLGGLVKGIQMVRATVYHLFLLYL